MSSFYHLQAYAYSFSTSPLHYYHLPLKFVIISSLRLPMAPYTICTMYSPEKSKVLSSLDCDLWENTMTTFKHIFLKFYLIRARKDGPVEDICCTVPAMNYTARTSTKDLLYCPSYELYCTDQYNRDLFYCPSFEQHCTEQYNWDLLYCPSYELHCTDQYKRYVVLSQLWTTLYVPEQEICSTVPAMKYTVRTSTRDLLYCPSC